MPIIIPGIDTQQLVVTVANNDTDINNEIAAQALNDYLLSSMYPNGANMTLLFQRNVPVT